MLSTLAKNRLDSLLSEADLICVRSKLVFGGLAWFGSVALAGVFSLAVVLNLLAGVFAGTVIPMGLERLGVDPALAGGVVLVTLTDAFGFGVFLRLGSWLLL